MSYDPTDCELGICELGDQISEAQVSVAKKTPIGTIDLTPSWESVVAIYLEVLTSEGADWYKQADAKREILRAAKLADLYVKEHTR